MELDLTRSRADACEASSPPLRPLLASDAEALAVLMLEGYRGTVDDEGEDLVAALAEARRTFEGGYGPMLWEASFAIDAPHGAGLLNASVVTFWRETPLLAFSVTHPSAQRRGLAAASIGASADALMRGGHARLTLVVTRGNQPAERLYERLGFGDVPR